MLASTKRNFSENFTKWIYIKKDTLQNEVLFDDRTSKYHVKDLDLTNLFRLQPDSFSILSTREEVDNGKNLVHYKVHLKDGLKSEYISSSVALFLSSSTIDIIIDKDLSTVQGLAIQHDDITTFFNIITVGTDPHIVDIPEKYITWEQRLEQKETWRARDPEDLPGFISATSTSYIGGNSSLGTSLDRSYKKIIIIPLGDVPPSDIKLITNALTSTFNAVSVEVASTVPLSQDMESASSSPKEKQYLYESLLKKMVKPYKDDSQILIGVLAADGTFSGRNFAHSLTFFDPEYDQPPSGVFSTFRIKNKIDQKITQLRYQKILQRIVGISVGLRPAASLNCPTAQAISLTAIDSKGTKWCGDDELLLQKVGLLKAQ
jgi:predicted Zn-dependent protease